MAIHDFWRNATSPNVKSLVVTNWTTPSLRTSQSQRAWLARFSAASRVQPMRFLFTRIKASERLLTLKLTFRTRRCHVCTLFVKGLWFSRSHICGKCVWIVWLWRVRCSSKRNVFHDAKKSQNECSFRFREALLLFIVRVCSSKNWQALKKTWPSAVFQRSFRAFPSALVSCSWKMAVVSLYFPSVSLKNFLIGQHLVVKASTRWSGSKRSVTTRTRKT